MKFISLNNLILIPQKTPKAEMVKIMTSDGLFNMPAVITYPAEF